MSDNFTEVTHQSWFSRITGAIGGIFFGLILVAGAVLLLFWNEGREVKTAKSLKEGEGAVISAEAGTVNPANNHKLVHVTAQAATAAVLRDPVFGVSANAIRLDRKALMYEWKETKKSETHKNLGGSTDTVTTYSYAKSWENGVIDSTHFNQAADHVNPTKMLTGNFGAVAKDVSFGAFKLPSSAISRMPGDEPLALDEGSLEKLAPAMKAKAHLADGTVYIGKDPQAPEIGDQKFQFTALLPGGFSIVARQIDNTFEPYPTHAGREIMIVEAGDVSADLMFNHAEKENQTLAWILRGVGVFVMFLGLLMIFSPISVFADVIPLLGDIIGMGTALAALLITMALSLITIAVAWITYRPVLGGGMLAVAIAWLVFSKRLGGKKAAAVAPAA